MKGFDSFGHKEPKVIVTTDKEDSNVVLKKDQDKKD